MQDIPESASNQESVAYLMRTHLDCQISITTMVLWDSGHVPAWRPSLAGLELDRA